MSWRDLLQKDNERITLPWTGGRSLRSATQVWTIKGPLPIEHAWREFMLKGRDATLVPMVEASDDGCQTLTYIVSGYLVGNRLVQDTANVNPNPKTIAQHSESVYMLEPGIDRFTRVQAGRIYEDGPLIYISYDMPLGPEGDVLNAFLDEKASVNDILGVVPALDAAFRMETWQRAEANRRRAELEKLRREEEEKRALAEKRQKLVEQLGDAQGRRAMAAVDFEQGARAALIVGGATYLDHKASTRQGEMIVRFRFQNQRFECVCDMNLRIIDSGICLTAHYDDEDYAEGTKGDQLFTLESLPSVILEAIRDHKLVVYRHA